MVLSSVLAAFVIRYVRLLHVLGAVALFYFIMISDRGYCWRLTRLHGVLGPILLVCVRQEGSFAAWVVCYR